METALVWRTGPTMDYSQVYLRFLKKKNISLAFQPLTPSSHSMSWLFAAILTPKVMEVSSPLKTKRKNDENIK